MPFSVTTDDNGYTLKKTENSPRELMEEPELVTTVNTGYENLHSVTCLSEEEFWTSAQVGDMKSSRYGYKYNQTKIRKMAK
jgi:hypothetical protein